MLLQCSRCCGASPFFFQVPVSLAAVVVELKRMLVLPRRSSVAAAAAHLHFFFQVPVSLAAVVVELKRMLVLPRRSSVAAAAAHLHFFFKFLCRWQVL